jgi:hypothetical protein
MITDLPQPRAAEGSFPYPGRTVEQVDIAEASRRDRLFGPKRAMIWCVQCAAHLPPGVASMCKSGFCPNRRAA